MAADPVFLDTNVLVAARVATHPTHAAAVALLDKLTGERPRRPRSSRATEPKIDNE
jgi:predicted nucleic acid-binding protein